jgi:hypothetical protein
VNRVNEHPPSDSPDTLETPLFKDEEASPQPVEGGTVRRMSALKAGLISAAVGLAIAAGVFAGLGLPGSLTAARSDSRYTVIAAIDETIHVGLGPFSPGGPRDIKIVEIALENASPAIQIDSIRITVFRGAAATVAELGSDTEPRPDIDALPLALGSVLKPGQDGAFWLTFHVTSTGQHTLDGLRVTYRSGWLTRTTVVGPRVRVRVGDERGQQVEQPRGRGSRDRSSRRSPVPTPS